MQEYSKNLLVMSKEEKQAYREEIQEQVKQILSEKRYLHSVGTMKKAKELAILYGEDEEKAMLTGIVHDIAKEMSKEDYFLYAIQNKIEIDDFDRADTTLLHAKIGADIVKKKYQFTEEMQNAILYHPTGRAGMTKLDKIIYVADKIEETRSYDGVETFRKLAKQNLDNAILWHIENMTIPHTIEKGKLLHPLSILTRNDIIKRKVNKGGNYE